MQLRSRTMIGLFLVTAGILTLTINSWNAQFFGLQNATVAALVEHHTFALVDQVIPGFNLVEGTETFRYGKHVYPMKQPGPTVLGAFIYLPLYMVGINYQNHFDYASNFVTFGTSTVMMAISSVLIYILCLKITKRTRSSCIAALLFPLSTLIWPYAGVSHHDIYGVFWSLLALTVYYIAHQKTRLAWLFVAGAISTFTLFFTMLPLTLPLAFLLMTLGRKKVREVVTLLSGMILGFLPTMIFNGLVFGNPLLPPNLAGQVSDTMPLLSVTNFLSKLWFYLGAPTTSLLVFSPVLLFGIAGIWQLGQKELWLKKLLVLIPLLQLLHISSMETFGGYQYGPRYLLPILGCLSIGIALWISVRHRPWTMVLFAALTCYSILVAGLGAIQTVMYPMPGPYAPLAFLTQMSLGKFPVFRLWPLGFGLFLPGSYLLYRQYNKHK